MNKVNSSSIDINPWYTRKGDDNDVIVSTKVRFARNLANFPFVPFFRGDDNERVQSIIYDAFYHFKNQDDFIYVNTDSLNQDGLKILNERGFLRNFFNKDNTLSPCGSSLVINSDGNNYSVINGEDHIHISSLNSGMAVQKGFFDCLNVDTELQNYLQFAASNDYGYLTTSLLNVGSGIRFSSIIHIPSIVKNGKFKEVKRKLEENGIKITPAFLNVPILENANGQYFYISTISSQSATEVVQLANFESLCKYLIDTERKNLLNLADNKKTINKNYVLKAFSNMKVSLLISYSEAIEIISILQFGLKLGLVSGIDNHKLSSLLYRIKPAHLKYLLDLGSFNFESDILDSDILKIDRLRAVVLQDELDNVSLGNL